MVSSRRGAVCAAWLVALTAGCTAPPDAARSTAQAINGGTNDSTHTNVVGIAILLGGGAATCTGSLIAPNLVLTARHCVSEIDDTARGIACSAYTDASGMHPATTARAPYPARNLFVTTETVMPMGTSGYHAVAQVLIPPSSTGVPFCGLDIALLRLREPITDVVPIEPRIEIRPEVGELFTASGYGATGSSGAGSGRRRMRAG